MTGERIVISGQDPYEENNQGITYDTEARRKALAAHIVRAGLLEHIDTAKAILGISDEAPAVHEAGQTQGQEPAINKNILRIERS